MSDFSYSKQVKLESLIAGGKWRFVFLHGVLGWGISTAFIIFVIDHFVMNTQLVNSFTQALMIYPAAGFLFGLVMWTMVNNEYRKMFMGYSEQQKMSPKVQSKH
ncbi:hypothetical protein Q4601_17575 [Shewanella sp. 1_MG-2023]|uniref:hypothetical protein n=1 Tax=unclassified Shewanella TaxID=196818 RepID=UPI000C822F80|nr:MULTISPECIES: hypothetical protein [unclassified Shewanella]MCC4833203.1 hypothetical protein [Shewanella sp. 10N.7]MDO6613164.1 hypothetical protein [Shewanella sp. 7_MG-2023]MDO6773033.1 hypothetical protein [Shewanella sp. 2_MG-2023]MDO6796111.1 hypothetical protein [Shewanella sp. 1_MG-2023]PMG79664.1 hypothetical protein BCU84_05005 [Shewanella sp. 10N.286.51.B7]